MSEPQARSRSPKARSNQADRARGPQDAPQGAITSAHSPGPLHSAGPVVGLGSPVQTKLTIGQAGDAYEQEAESVANRVAAGPGQEIPAISSIGPMAAQPAKEERERKPAQKAESKKPEEKKQESKPAQKAGAKEPEEKKPDKAQKAESKKPEEKKPDKVQKAEAKKPEEKKSDQKAVQKAEGKKHEEKKPEPTAGAGNTGNTMQRAEEKTGSGGGKAGPTPAHAGTGSTHENASAGQAAPTTEDAIARSGPGHPMNPQTRDTLESRMGADLGDVRVHDDRAAQEAAGNINARAFTHGHDIWLGRGESDTDVNLMAHEATHVVQQSNGAGVKRQTLRRKAVPATAPPTPYTQGGESNPSVMQDNAAGTLVQRAPTPAPASGVPAGGPASPGQAGQVDDDKKVITMPEIQLPDFKIQRGKYPSPLNVPKSKKAPEPPAAPPAPPGGSSAPAGGADPAGAAGDDGGKKAARDTKQIKKWRTAVQAGSDSGVTSKLKGMENRAVKSGTSGQDIYFLKSTNAQAKFYLFGTEKGIMSEARVPYWDRTGNERLLEVDHKREIQLGGEDEAGNYELLDADANWNSGIEVRREIGQRVSAVAKDYTGADAKVKKIWDKPPKLDTILINYDLNFEKVKGGLKLPRGKPDPNQFWSLDEAQTGKHLEKLEVMTPEEVGKRKLMGTETQLMIYTASRGGTPRDVPWEAGKKEGTFSRKDFYPGFELTRVEYESGASTNKIMGRIWNNNKLLEGITVTWPIRRAPGIGYGGYIDDIGIMETIVKAQVKGASPVEFRQAGLDDQKGLYAVGQVLPTVPLIKDAGIELVIEGNDVRLRKVFDTGDFSFPGPIKVTDSSLEISGGTASGLAVTGLVQFQIERVGKGSLKGGASTGKGFEIEGEFNFDSKMFDKAEIKAWYRNNAFGAAGELAIEKEGKVKGIKSARVTASYQEDKLDATGKAELSVPGVKSASLTLSYSQEEGLLVAGSFELAENIPGIKSGSGQAKVKQKPGTDEYQVSASGTAVPKIPGVDATLAFAYEDGAITIEGSAAYEKGMLKGSVLIGATNRPVGNDGKPGGEPTKQLTAYGGGTVTIKIAPWLQGTVGIKLLPNGEIEVSGSIGLPSSLNIFPEKSITKNIFTIGIDIPIVGVAAAGQRVGIFANISGGLDLSAGIGPGQLQEVGLGVTYNPAHEDQTHVTGSAKLHIPAHAGLRLFVRGGIGAGIPLVSAQAGIEIGGGLGLEGAVDAGVQVDWTPTRGLVLDAVGEIYVEPKLKFDISAFVLVELDLFIDTITLYDKHWQLASFEYGSGLRFGVKFPIHYEEGKPFDISLSDLQFQVPDIKPKEMLSDLMSKIV